MVGCETPSSSGVSSWESVFIRTSDLGKPASMSPRVGVNPSQKYEEVRKLSGVFSSSLIFWKGTNPFQEKLREAVKDSERRAIRDIEIEVEFGETVIFPLLWKRNHFVYVNGSVIEAE